MASMYVSESEPQKPDAIDAYEKVPDVDHPELSDVVAWVDEWEEDTATPRELARQDRDYYDGNQLTQEELDDLENRGQPAIIKNRIARKVNTVLGDEIDKRVDPVARPRTPQHTGSARAVTDGLRYVADEQEFNRVRTAVFKNILVEGMGGALKSVDDDGKHVLTHIEWDRLIYDPKSRRADFKDAKFLGILLWQDLDDAIADNPDADPNDLNSAVANDQITSSAETTEDTPRGAWADRRRQRVKIAEIYYRIGRNYYWCRFTKGAWLVEPTRTAILDEKNKYSVNPLLLTSCYVDRNGARRGIVRDLISPQDEVNKRASKALHLLNVRSVIAEHDVVADPDKFMEQIAKPDGFAEVEAGALQEQRILIHDGSALAAPHVQLMQMAMSDIDTIGPSASNLPDLPQAASGRAILARTKAAAKEIQPVYDALEMWTLAVYTIDWLCIRSAWTEEKWLRVTDDNELEGYRFTGLNRRLTRAARLQELLEKQPPVPLPKALETAAGEFAPLVLAQAQALLAQQHPPQPVPGQPPPDPQQAIVGLVLHQRGLQQDVTVDQVDQILVDIILDTTPNTAVIEQEEFEQWAQLAPSLVQGGLDPREAAKLTVQLSQFRDKNKVLEMLNKQPPPQVQQQQQMIQQLQQQMAQVELQLKQSEVAKNQADTQLSAARAQAEMASLGQPHQASTVDQARAQRELVKTQLDVARTQAQVGRDHAATQRDVAAAETHRVDQVIKIQRANQPPEVPFVP